MYMTEILPGQRTIYWDSSENVIQEACFEIHNDNGNELFPYFDIFRPFCSRMKMFTVQ